MKAIALVVLVAVVALPPGLRGKDIESLPTRARVVALTFDAGADAGHAWTVVRTLGRAHVPATFFVTGEFARRYPRLTGVIARSYMVGNHSDTHPRLTRLPDAAVRAQIVGAERSIAAAAERSPTHLFRFPYGDRDARTIAIVNALGYVCVRWSIDTLGWMGRSPSAILERVLTGLHPGAIVLMHLASFSRDADALASVIAHVRARGYRFVTLQALASAQR